MDSSDQSNIRYVDTPVKKEKHIGLIIGVSIATFFIIIVLFILFSSVRYGASVSVISGVSSVASSVDSLDFGSLAPETSVTRLVIVENKTPIPMRIIVRSSGKLAKIMRFNKNYFRVPAGNGTGVELNISVPRSTAPGTEIKGGITVFKIPFI